MTNAELTGTASHEDSLPRVIVKALLVPGGPGVSDRVLVYSEDQSICFETDEADVLSLFLPGESSIYLYATWRADSEHLLIFRGRAERQDW